VVKRIASRLDVNIAGLGTATHVYCSVRVDVDDVDHELFNEDWASTGNKLDATDTYDFHRAAIFNLLKDGAAHTFYFLFWADVASQATIDSVQLWEGVGHCGGGPDTAGRCLDIKHNGITSQSLGLGIVGTGTPTILLSLDPAADWTHIAINTGSMLITQVLIPDTAFLATYGTVDTDLNYLTQLVFVLRSEQ